MPFVRVKDSETGHEYTVDEAVAEGTDTLTVVDKPAVDANGAALEPKYNVLETGTKAARTAAAKEKE